jgi:hypothetical protein
MVFAFLSDRRDIALLYQQALPAPTKNTVSDIDGSSNLKECPT